MKKLTAAFGLAVLVSCTTSVVFVPDCFAAPTNAGTSVADLRRLETRYARIRLDDKGFIVSLIASATGKDYVPAGRPSPVLALHENGSPNDTLLAPVSADFRTEKGEIALTYANGAVATVTVAVKDGYVRFKLIELTNRGKVDNVVWGPLKTVIGKEGGRIGDSIGVVRDPDFAIGMVGVDDNTISGPVTDSDAYTMGYYIHSTDPKKDPLPANLKEGQWFRVGGNGSSDTAFYSHPEQYFRWIYGNGARVEPEYGSTVAYHSRDRRRSYNHFYAIIGGHSEFRPRHMVSDPVPGVDFIGSTIVLYACPDDLGLTVLEKIYKDEGMPFVTDMDGKWIRSPAAIRPTLWWNGPVDKAIEYAKAMGFRNISRDTGEHYSSRAGKWVGHVPLADGKSLTYKEFGDRCHAAGLTHGGLHEMCMFLQGGRNGDVTPVPSEHLQTVCRTKLAKDISATDTEIVVTDPSFLADKGTWTVGDKSNFLRIGGELLRYDGISDSAPWTLKGVKRGHATKAVAHKAGDELVKLMENCYRGFVPDMTLMLEYAEYYGELMALNGMDDIGFDGYECLMYQNHGFYAVKAFNRRLFDTYHKLTGRWPHITTASSVFNGSWEYLATCNLGGGGHMFDIPNRRWAIEGKDFCNAHGDSWYPPTMGGQSWNSDWTLYEAENLMSMAAGWDGTFGLNVTQAAIDATGDRDAIFKAFKAWMTARGLQAFTKEQKERLKVPGGCFHLEQTGATTFVLSEIRQTSVGSKADDKANPSQTFKNAGAKQPLDFVFKLAEPHSKPFGVEGLTMTLPDGTVLTLNRKFVSGEVIVCRDGKVHLVDAQRKRTEIPLKQAPMLPAGDSRFVLKTAGSSKPDSGVGIWTVHTRENAETVGR